MELPLTLAIDLVCEDGHAPERSLMEQSQSRGQPGELWIADRNFSTRRILYGVHGRDSGFILREHGRTNSWALEEAWHRERIETSMANEQGSTSRTTREGQRLRLRWEELQLHHATAEGDTTIRLLTNLPTSQFTPRRIARLHLI